MKAVLYFTVQDEVQENGNQSNFQNGVNIVPIMNQSTESNFQNEINNVPITNLGPYYGKLVLKLKIIYFCTRRNNFYS